MLLEREPRLKVLFLVEGFTDIRFVQGLSEISRLTLVVPQRQFHESKLAERLVQSGAQLEVIEVPGNRLTFQARSFAHVLSRAGSVDVILAQEVLRGALNANLAGLLRRVPVVMHMGIAPVEYFRCRRERHQLGPVAAAVGEGIIRALMTVNGRLSTRWLALGDYLQGIASTYSTRTEIGRYYGVDTDVFRPADEKEKQTLRQKLELPRDRFIIFFSSRVSHEKDPETALLATARVRQQGLDAVLLNLGGGYEEFLALAKTMGLTGTDDWVLGRPPAHPVTEVMNYFRASDLLVQASLAEGLGLAPLEALACGVPVVATAVGGMAVALKGYADLTPRQDPDAMAEAILKVSREPLHAREQALRGREYVIREWSRKRAFEELRGSLERAARSRP